MAMTGKPQSLDEKSARVRNLLSSYYGTPDSSVPDSPVSQSSSRDHPLVRQPRSVGLDSTAFDSNRFINQLLGTTRLQPLLQKHLEMNTEIKSLDSDMQMLVYENYNKFISATDTIRTMKSSVDDMDEKMRTLKELIGGIAGKSTAVNTKLQQRQDQMEDLSRIRGLLIKLQAVFQLPKQLRAAIDQGAVELAVEKYADVAGLLRNYGHKGAFRKINTEVQACAKELTSTLRRRLAEQDGDAAECIVLLERLGEPSEALQDAYLNCLKGRAEAILHEAETFSLRTAQDEGQDEDTDAKSRPQGLSAFVVQLDQKFITELSGMSVAYDRLFSQGGRQRLVQVAKSLFGSYLQILRQQIHATAHREAKRSVKMVGELSGSDAPGQAIEWGATELASALSNFATDVSRLQNLLPELSVQDRAAEVVEKAVRQHVGDCFDQLKEETFLELCRLQASMTSQAVLGTKSNAASDAKLLYEGYRKCTGLLENGIASILQGIRSYQQQSVILRSWQDVFVDLVQGHVQHLFLSLLEGLAAIGLQEDASEHAQSKPTWLQLQQAQLQPGFILVLARICNSLETNAVVKVLELLAALFAGQGASAGEDQPPAFVAGDVARRLGLGAQLLLEEYAKLQGSGLSEVLQPVLLNQQQLESSQSQAASSSRSALVSELLSHAEIQVSFLLNKKSNSLIKREDSSAGGSSSALERDVARLFNQRGSQSVKLSFTQASILGGIVRIALKAFVESIRLSILSKSGLQQLQLEVYNLRQILPRYLQGAETTSMHSLLDEALAAAIERCSEPVLLDTSALEKSLAVRTGL